MTCSFSSSKPAGGFIQSRSLSSTGEVLEWGEVRAGRQDAPGGEKR
ncbi:MAG: hypothetical protein LBG68_03020 [Coriobacteriales bacterium]|nr:hypothetical protein [Coriobacteriales bacterium]